MRLRLSPPWRTKVFLMDWAAILGHWSRSDQFRHLDSAIDSVYSKLWFDTRKHGEARFFVGEVCYMNPDWPLAFVNGTHRTRVLARFLPSVPLAARADVYRRKLLDGCIICEIAKDEYFELPDLQICEPEALRRQDRDEAVSAQFQCAD